MTSASVCASWEHPHLLLLLLGVREPCGVCREQPGANILSIMISSAQEMQGLPHPRLLGARRVPVPHQSCYKSQGSHTSSVLVSSYKRIKLTAGSISELPEQHNAATATARAPSSKITAKELTSPWAHSQLQGMLWLHTQEQICAAGLKEKGVCSHCLCKPL